MFLQDGDQREYQKMISISGAEFTASPASGYVPLTVRFDASVLEKADAPAASFEWDFDGDGVYEENLAKPSTEFTFEKIGNYEVKLRITDIHNTPRYYSKKIEVQKNPSRNVEANINVSPGVSGMAPFKINLNGAESTTREGDIKTYEWDLGDGTSMKYGRNISYEYKREGEYIVTLTVYNTNNESDRETIKIEVAKTVSVPVAVITSEPSVEEGHGYIAGVAPLTVVFDASESEDSDDNIVEYAWDFNGDETFDAYGQKVEHIFEIEGDYKVVLKVADTDNQSSEAELLVKVTQRELQAILLAEPLSGPVPLKVEFDASTSVYKKGNIVSYEWDFGEKSGAHFGDAIKSHIFQKKGQYIVKLKVFTEDGKTDVTTKEIFVRDVQLQACFSMNPATGSAPLTVEFDSTCSKGEVTEWKWDFGDGFISTGHSPVHTYNQMGTYTVSLELVDNKNNVNSYDNTIVVTAD